MPPQNSCSSRNKVLLSKFSATWNKDPNKVTNLLARALANDDELSQFKDSTTANECIFSYPDSDWYSIYLSDPNGETFWNESGQRVQRVYFKLIIDASGRDAAIGERTTVIPPELVGKTNCIITAGGNCGNPQSYKKTPPPKAPSASAPKSKSKTSSTGDGPSLPEALPVPVGGKKESTETRAETLSRIQTVQVGAGAGEQSHAKIERTYFENLGSKELIIDWMIKNMKHTDIIQCIKRSSLSADQIRQVEALVEQDPPPSRGVNRPDIPNIPQDELQLVQDALASMPASKAKKALTEVTKQELIDFLNSIKDQKTKANKIVALCKYAGINKYSVSEISGRGGKKIYKVMEGDFEIQPDEMNEIIDECAAKEAIRVTRLIKGKSMARDSRAQRQLKGSLSSSPTRSDRVAEIQNIIDTIRSNPDKNQKIIEIANLCVQNGLTEFNTKTVSGRGGKVIVKLYEDDAEIDPTEFDDILEECGKVALGKVTSFGKKRNIQGNFKKAAKQCKGTNNYRNCMKRTLRKMYSFGKKRHYDVPGSQCNKLKKPTCRSNPNCTYTVRGCRRRSGTATKGVIYEGPSLQFGKKCLKKYTIAGKRKSPGVSATLFNLNTKQKGLDGNLWVIKQTSAGIKRWVKM